MGLYGVIWIGIVDICNMLVVWCDLVILGD